MHNNPQHRPDRRLWIPALVVGCAATFAAGGAFALWNRGEDQTIVTPDADVEVSVTASAGSPSSSESPSSDDPSAPDSGDDSEGPTSSADDAAPDAIDPTSGDTLDDGRPATFWAITEETYELVEVDTLSGEVIGRYGGWGAPFGDCEGDEGCLAQAIDDVQLAADGTLFISDCCEPAVGNIYRIQAGEQLDPLTAGSTRYGTSPLPSPDVTLVASDELGAIAIRSADGEELLATHPAGGSGGGQVIWHTPLTWLDETTIVFSATQGDAATLGFLDVSDPANPVVVGRTIDGSAFLDAGIRSDGNVLALEGSPIEGVDDPWLNRDIVGRAYDLDTGEVLAEFDLPNSVYDMDYDASHTYLITSGSDGVIRWYGAGTSGEIGAGFIAATW